MKIFNKKIKENFDYEFEIEEDELYAIEIVASCKSWWQNLIKFTSFFKDDDLTIKIDDIKFPKLNGKKGLFDGEAAWNGNNLKGLKKTNIFLIKLEKGKHIIHFLIDQEPYLESVNIYKLQDPKNISFAPESNNPPEDGNRRQWLNIALVNLSLKNFFITASAGKRKVDDDDLKLIIDGEIQKNTEAKSHKYWYWCGRTLEGKQKEFHKEINLPQGLHYIELWADRSPEIEEINLKIEGLKRIPTVDNSEWTRDFYDDPKEIILARLIFGEARNQPREAKIWIARSVLNRVKSKSWPNTIHEVILQPNQYDPFKPDDPNFSKIIDPLKEADSLTEKAWYECYEIAIDIIYGKIKNPTEATHFHGIGISKEEFLKNVVPQGRFLRQIGNVYFYWSPN